MAKQSFQLDPNAQAYTPDEIVNKVNAASSKVDADQVQDGSTNKVYTGTEQSKLTSIADNATIDQDEANIKTLFSWATSPEDGATADQTGLEVQTAIIGLADADRELVKTDPQIGEFPVLAIQRTASGLLDIDFDDVAV